MKVGRLTQVFCAFMGLALLPGCAGNGLFCKGDHDNPRVAALMRDSCGGDRAAAMQLGLWFEGQEDFEVAVHYYRIAATPSGGQAFIYVPGAGDVAGYTMPVDTGPRLPGSAEAQYRLGLMYRDGKGVKRNVNRARRFFERAAEQGHEGALSALAAMN